MLFANPHARHEPYPDALRELLDLERARECRRWLAHWDQITSPTPLRPLPGLARRLGAGRLFLVDGEDRERVSVHRLHRGGEQQSITQLPEAHLAKTRELR